MLRDRLDRSLRRLGRRFLRLWLASDVTPGYAYQVVDRVGGRLGDGRLTRALPDGSVVDCDLRDHVQRQLYYYGAYEPVEAWFFTRLLRPGMVVVDAGANVGQYTLLAARAVGPSGHVHAFEPMPQTFARLEANVRRNGLANVSLNAAALWSAPGTLSLGFPADVPDNAGAATAAPSNSPRVVVPSVTLDAYLADRPRVDLIKMDIEGAEPWALEGAARTLAERRPLILCEVLRRRLVALGSTPAKLGAPLFALGYRAWRLGSTSATSGPVHDLEALDQANVVFHPEAPPPCLLEPWSLRDALRWARGR